MKNFQKWDPTCHSIRYNRTQGLPSTYMLEADALLSHRFPPYYYNVFMPFLFYLYESRIQRQLCHLFTVLIFKVVCESLFYLFTVDLPCFAQRTEQT